MITKNQSIRYLLNLTKNGDIVKMLDCQLQGNLLFFQDFHFVGKFYRKLINQQSKRAVIAADITLSTVKSVNFNDSSDAKIIGDSDTMIFNNTTSEGVIDEAPGDDQNLETKSNEQIEELERIEE